MSGRGGRTSDEGKPLADATIAYQAQLELLRSAENGFMDEEFLEKLREDLGKAKRELEIAWLEDR